eukprot:GHVU01047864.1.p1 GENE.GHVU01047864.1~~GHVU01047864.1.p1  ORF type:complete len:843 (+),score=128.05 GHVU01047864.1:104-2530(+)
MASSIVCRSLRPGQIASAFLLLLGIFKFQATVSWPHKTAEEGQVHTYNPHSCPYYDANRHGCVPLVGQVMDRNRCDCSTTLTNMMFKGAYATRQANPDACRASCTGRCQYFGYEISGSQGDIKCLRFGTSCDHIRAHWTFSQGEHEGNNAYSPDQRIVRVIHQTGGLAYHPPAFPAKTAGSWTTLRDNCAPRCPEVHTVILITGGNPLNNKESVTNATDGVKNWSDCVRHCTGYHGHRIKDESCLVWNYFADTQEVEDKWGKHLRGACVTYQWAHGYRHAGYRDSYAGTRFTGQRNCSATCVTSQWSAWDSCTNSCGGGTRSRSRTQMAAASKEEWWDTYVQHNTPYPSDSECGSLEEQQECNSIACPIPCKWGDWSYEWGDWINNAGECSRSCGGGFAYRSRNIISHAQNGAPECNLEDAQEAKECNSDVPCEGCHVGPWSTWSECPVTCELGNRTREREPSSEYEWMPGCMDLQQNMTCKVEKVCPVDCLLEDDWQPWADCSKGCGGGRTIRTRKIINWNAGTGKECDEFEQANACNVHHCPVDCVMGLWGSWSDCSQSCGVGRRHRTRSPSTYPQGDGKTCDATVDEETCNPGTCEAHANTCFELNTFKNGTVTFMTQQPSPEKCQEDCSAKHWSKDIDVTCNFFSYDQISYNCRMLSTVDDSETGPEYARYISGPRACTGDEDRDPNAPDPDNVANGTASTGSQVPIGAIVGASIGGIALLGAVGGGIAYGVKKKQEADEAAAYEDEEEEGYEEDGDGDDDEYPSRSMTKDFLEEGGSDSDDGSDSGTPLRDNSESMASDMGMP